MRLTFWLFSFPCPILLLQFLSINSVIVWNAFLCIEKYVGIAGFGQWFQSLVQGLLGTQDPFKRYEKSSCLIIILTIHYLHFFAFILSVSEDTGCIIMPLLWWLMQCVRQWWKSHSFLLLDIQIIWKQVKQCYFSHLRCLLWKISLSWKYFNINL